MSCLTFTLFYRQVFTYLLFVLTIIYKIFLVINLDLFLINMIELNII